jgi:hypothetical protein
MDPITLTTLIVTACGLFLSIFQSIKENHFESECFKCCKITNDYKGKDNCDKK